MSEDLIKGFGNLDCKREQDLALELFNLLRKDKLTELAQKYFDKRTSDVCFNASSGYVFLSDEDYNVVMEYGRKLDLFITLSYGGQEGFFEDLMMDFEDLHIEDKQQLRDMATDKFLKEYKKQFDKLNKEEVLEKLK